MKPQTGRVTRLKQYPSKLGKFLWPDGDFHSRKMSSLMGELQYKRSESLEYNLNSILDALNSFEPDYVVFSPEDFEEQNRRDWKEIVRPLMITRMKAHFDLNERKQVLESVTYLLDRLIAIGCKVEGYEQLVQECDLMAWEDHIATVLIKDRPKGIRILRSSELSFENLSKVCLDAGLDNRQAERLICNFLDTNEGSSAGAEVYGCNKCKAEIDDKEANFCTACGEKIKNKVPPEFLEEVTLKSWNSSLIGYAVLIALGAIATVLQSESGLDLYVILGLVGLVSGGVFLSTAGPFRIKKKVLIDTRKK